MLIRCCHELAVSSVFWPHCYHENWNRSSRNTRRTWLKQFSSWKTRNSVNATAQGKANFTASLLPAAVVCSGLNIPLIIESSPDAVRRSSATCWETWVCGRRVGWSWLFLELPSILFWFLTFSAQLFPSHFACLFAFLTRRVTRDQSMNRNAKRTFRGITKELTCKNGPRNVEKCQMTFKKRENTDRYVNWWTHKKNGFSRRNWRRTITASTALFHCLK